MRVQIIKSSFLIVSLLATTVGATRAFFSDTETTTGNIVVAGSIDLKVDHHRATYNGMMCEQNVWRPVCQEESGNLIQNGDFELPVVSTPSGRALFSSTTPVLGWQFVRRANGTIHDDLEFHRSYEGWQSASNQQHVELDSETSMRIAQKIITIPGRTYKLSYAFAPRPDIEAKQNKLAVAWGGMQVATSGPMAGTSTVSWFYNSVWVVATTTLTEVAFADVGSATGKGTFLDDVQLVLLDCPAAPLAGTSCREWEEKDLTNEQFFNFSDVKPGDWGSSVVSLHVYDNSAWACMLIKNAFDWENDLREVEVVDGDYSEFSGELSNNLTFFLWRDDGDGVYEPAAGEQSVGQGLWGSFVTTPLFDATNGLVLSTTTTAHIAVAWCNGQQEVNHNTGVLSCDGSGVSNTQQTDSFVADVVFLAEQMRNNPDFTCSSFAPPVFPDEEFPEDDLFFLNGERFIP